MEDYSSDEEGPDSNHQDYFYPENQARQEEEVCSIEQTLSSASRQRLAKGEWLLGNYSARQFFAFGLEKLTREDVERQAALNQALMDAHVFKAQSNQIVNKGLLEYRKIFDINSQVQQKLVGQLQDDIHSEPLPKGSSTWSAVD